MSCHCDREHDVLDALAGGRWPDRCDDELLAHVDACSICRDTADVADAIIHDRNMTCADAPLPSAGLVWWRAQLRAREDAARAAGRPVAFIQGVAVSIAVWLFVALMRALPSDYLTEWRTWFTSSLPAWTITMADAAGVLAAIPLAIAALMALWFVVAPVALYFAAGDD